MRSCSSRTATDVGPVLGGGREPVRRVLVELRRARGRRATCAPRATPPASPSRASTAGSRAGPGSSRCHGSARATRPGRRPGPARARRPGHAPCATAAGSAPRRAGRGGRGPPRGRRRRRGPPCRPGSRPGAGARKRPARPGRHSSWTPRTGIVGRPPTAHSRATRTTPTRTLRRRSPQPRARGVPDCPRDTPDDPSRRGRRSGAPSRQPDPSRASALPADVARPDITRCRRAPARSGDARHTEPDPTPTRTPASRSVRRSAPSRTSSSRGPAWWGSTSARSSRAGRPPAGSRSSCTWSASVPPTSCPTASASPRDRRRPDGRRPAPRASLDQLGADRGGQAPCGPLAGGVSIGPGAPVTIPVDGTGPAAGHGTLSVLATDRRSGRTLALTNLHVAAVDGLRTSRAPGSSRRSSTAGSRRSDRVGALVRGSLTTTSTRPSSRSRVAHPGYPASSGSDPCRVEPAPEGSAVRKRGRTTGLRTGTVTSADFTTVPSTSVGIGS